MTEIRNLYCEVRPHTYDYWHDALDGLPATLPAGQHVGLGFYRKRERAGDYIGIAIWLKGDRPMVKVGDRQWSLIDTAAEEDFAFGTMQWAVAVTQEAYDQWVATGKWPDDLPEITLSNTAGEPHLVVSETITELRDEAEKWLKEIGGAIASQEHADRAANFADRFHELAKEAETKREAEKRPHLDAGRACDAKWNAIRDDGREAKKWANGLTEAFLKAKRAQLLDEAAKAAAAGQPVRDADVKVRAGTRGRATVLRKVGEPRTTDRMALIEHYRNDARFWDRPNVNAELGAQAALDTKAGVKVPGFEIVTVETAA